MKIISLTLVGYRGFKLRQIQHFHYRPTQKTQIILGSNGSGKAQPLSTLIKTPSGWTKMKDLSIGSKVVAKDGSYSSIVKIHPQGIQQTYKITFKDGRSTIATGDHLWKIYCAKKYPITSEVVDTNEIIKRLNCPRRMESLVWIDLIDSENSEDLDLPMDPYVFGVTLGRCKSYEKFIPEIYLHASTRQRLELLQGLMDTDGYIDLQSTTSYYTTSQRLAYEVQYLVRSLGGIAAIGTKDPHYHHNGELRYGRKAYNVNIRYKVPSDLFKLSRKKERANDNNQYAKTLRLRIESITPVGYEECQCIEIDHPDHLYVANDFIVTHNSSTVKELSPLPALHTDYVKGGRKEIEIEHHGKHYLLQSLFDTDGNRYVFNVDGENLNPGYTITVYKELVKAHFGYTTEIHALLTGVTRFHSMPVNERRAWFMNLSDTDYTYAISYYKRLKEKVRDLQGALKLNQTRLTQETEKCLSEKAESELRVTVTELTQVLNLLLNHRKPRLLNAQSSLQSTEQLDQQLTNTITRLESLLSQEKGLHSPSPLEALEHAQNHLQATIQASHREVAHYCEVLDGYQKELAIVLQTSSNSLEEVQRSIRDLNEEQEQLERYIRLPLNFENVETAHLTFETIKDGFTHLLTELSKCERYDYRRDDYQYLLQSRPFLTQKQLKVKAYEDTCFAEKKALEAHKEKGEVNCPKCDNRWYPNYDELKYQQAIRKHEEAMAASRQVALEIEKTEDAINKMKTLFELTDLYSQFVTRYAVLAPYWAYLNHTELLLSNPEQLMPSIQTLTTDLQYHVKLLQLKKRLSEQTKLETLMQNTKQVDRTKLQENIDKETAKLNKLQTDTHEARRQLEILKTTISTRKLIHGLEEQIQTGMAQREIQYHQLIEDQCVGVLDEIIRNVRLTVSQHERTLSQIDIQKAIVISLAKQVKEIEEQLKVLKLAVKALSPTEGLIARGMTSFINHFVKQINAFIAKIWLYPLELIPITLDDDDMVDLDYRFAVRVNNDHISKDVSLTSAGMQEVIDLAFSAVSMKYLGLSNAPIFLDEFAVRMDAAHRQSAYRVIEHLIDSTDYSQVFLVSHYQDGYSSLNAAEVLVLCDSNVQLPKHLAYNQHVTFN